MANLKITVPTNLKINDLSIALRRLRMIDNPFLRTARGNLEVALRSALAVHLVVGVHNLLVDKESRVTQVVQAVVVELIKLALRQQNLRVVPLGQVKLAV